MAEEKAVELLEKIEKMKSCYLKGFGNYIQGITLTAHEMLYYPNDKVEVKENGDGKLKSGIVKCPPEKLKEERTTHIKSNLSGIREFYNNIPFNQIKEDVDFIPLFQIKDMLPEFEVAIESFLENPSDAAFKKIKDVNKKIMDIAPDFYNALTNYARELRKIPGYENYNVKFKHKTRPGYVDVIA